MNTPAVNISKSLKRKHSFFQTLDHILGRSLSVKLTKKSRKSYYNKLFDHLSKHNEGTLIPVDRVKDLSQEEIIERYVSKGIPVIIEGAASEWKCVKEWSLEYFKDLHGTDEIVLVNQKEDADHLGFEKLTLAEVIDGIEKGLSRYYRFYPLLERHPEHLMDFDVKWLRNFKKGYSPIESFQVFMGANGSTTPLHNASLGNLFIQVTGEKEWILYPNEYVPLIDPDPVRNIYRNAPIRKNNAPFCPFNPDYEYPFQLYKYAHGFKMKLKPGDIFYNPPYYWHAVRNIGNAIGVGYRWLPILENLKNWPMHTLMDLTTRKPNFFKTVKYTRQDINLLHLAEIGQLHKYKKEQRQKDTSN